jgi:hypothetical protein
MVRPFTISSSYNTAPVSAPSRGNDANVFAPISSHSYQDDEEKSLRLDQVPVVTTVTTESNRC